MRQAYTIALTLLLASAAALPADAAERRRGPKGVHHHEELRDPAAVSASTHPDGRSDGVVASFHAFGRSFHLMLEPNPLFTSGAEDTWIGGRGGRPERLRAKPAATFYRGRVHGEPDSWLRVSLRDGVLDGLIKSEGELYFVEPAARFYDSPTDAAMVVYRLSDTDSDLPPGSCALDDPVLAAELGSRASHGGRRDYRQLESEFQSLSAGSMREIDLGLVADYEYYLEHGSASAADMQNVINQVDGIFESELGLTIRVANTVVYTTSADPFSATTDARALLEEFSSYKSSASSPVQGTDLAQLFTNRDLAGSTVGIAWLSTLCSNGYGSSVTQDFTTTAKSLTILSAHELGHNLAAPHDAQAGSACESTAFGYLMYPSVSTNLNLQYSACSKSYIQPEIDSATCLADVSASTCSFSTSPTSASVGSGGGSGSVAVTAGSGCSWTAASNASWLTVSSGASGTGNGTVAYSAAANPGPSSRTGTLTVAGRTFTVTQAAPSAASITVTAPNGGQAWAIGSVKSILWSSSGVSGSVKIELSRDGGTNWSVISSGTANDGAYGLTVTGPATTAARVRISSVDNPTIKDTSDANFRIGGGTVTVVAPNGGEIWTVGTVRTIKWSSQTVAGSVRIDVSRNGGSTWTALVTSTPNDGSFDWTVSSPSTEQARIRVQSRNESTASDMSNANFSIR